MTDKLDKLKELTAKSKEKLIKRQEKAKEKAVKIKAKIKSGLADIKDKIKEKKYDMCIIFGYPGHYYITLNSF